MNEPSAALDVGPRQRLQDPIVAEPADANIAIVFVTHDVADPLVAANTKPDE